MNAPPNDGTAIPCALLQGPRLRLRAWQADDLAPFAALTADAEVMRHFPSTLDRAASDELAARIQTRIAAQGWGFWAVESTAPPADGAGLAPGFLGFVGLNRPAMALPIRTQGPCVEIGWRLARAAWGQGLACEAAQLALRIGFTVLDLPEIVAFTAFSNQRSQALMQRLGMVRDAAGDFDHPGLPAGHALARHCLYRLTSARWAALQAS